MINLKKSKIYKAILVSRFIRSGLLKFLKWLFFLSSLAFLFFYIAWNPFSHKEERNIGVALILFSLFGFCWLFLSFFNQKLKNPNVDESEDNLVDFLDFEAAKVVIQALAFKKYSFNLSLFLFLVGKNDLDFTFSRLLLSQDKVYEATEDVWKKEGLDKKDSFKDAETTILNALNIASSRGKDKISIFHLLGAISENDPLIRKVLSKLKISKEDVFHAALWQEIILDKTKERKKFWIKENMLRRRPLARNWTAGYTPFLDSYSRDITNSVKVMPLRNFLLHEKEMAQLEDALVKKGDNCAVLVGEVGVGKKELIYNLANKLLEERSYSTLNFNRILELNMPAIFSASSSLEEVEANLQTAFVEATNAGDIIIFINDIHNYIGLQADKDAVTKIDISGILSEYISYPTFRVIATTTPGGFQTAMSQSSIVMSRLTKIEVPPATREETLLVLEEALLPMEKETKLLVSFPALMEIINLSDRYIGDIPFPKKAIDLLNEIFIYKIRKRIGGKVILPEEVAEFVSEKTEVPVGETGQEEKEMLLNLEALIHERLINQEEAVSEVANALRRARADIKQKKRTLGNFLFLGPTGVGKTETAKSLARVYFGNEKRMIRLDMSEYQDIESINRLIGNAKEPGYLTKMVREDPFSLILLDEIEKAYPNILNLFLQVLDEGSLTDGAGRSVNFKNTIIIATSNAGAELIRGAIKEGKKLQEYKEEFIDEILKRGIFRPEFLNRFDSIVLFKTLSKEDLERVAKIMLEDIKKGLYQKEINFEITQELIEKIAEMGFDPEFGAREMRRVIQEKVENSIAKTILADNIKAGDSIEIDAENFEVKLVTSN